MRRTVRLRCRLRCTTGRARRRARRPRTRGRSRRSRGVHHSTRMQPRTPRSSPWPPGPGDSGTRGATRSGGAGIRGVEQAAEGDERVVAEAGEGDVAVTVALVGRGRVDDQPAHGDLHLPDGERELDDVAAVEALRGAQAEATG